jgi:hypothetical protein
VDSQDKHQVAEVLRGHDTPANALVVPDQPYNRGGSIRTTFRYWVNTTARGQQQLVTQAKDPYSGNWNPLRLGLPAGAVFLVRYDSGRIGGIETPVVWWPSIWVSFWLTGVWPHLTSAERSQIAHHLDVMKARNETDWSAWGALIDHMVQRGLPTFGRILGIETHMRPDEYADLTRYIRLGGPDLREPDWFTTPGDAASAGQTEPTDRTQ